MSPSTPVYQTFSHEDWIEGIIGPLAATHNIFLLTYHIYHMNRSKLSILQVTSILAITFPIFYNLTAGLNPWISWLRTSSAVCSVWMKTSTFFYGLSKTLIYLVFMERLFTVFTGSYLSFNKRTKIQTRTAFLIFAIIVCGVVNVWSDSIFNPITGRCEWKPAAFSYLLGACSCVIAEVCISVAFSRRLVQLNALQTSMRMASAERPEMDTIDRSSSNTSTSRSSFRNANHHSMSWFMLQKSAVCTFITLVSTPWSILMGYFLKITGLWAAIDLIICSWMVMLIFGKHDRIYSRFCRRCESLLWTPCLYYYTCFCCTDLETSIDGRVSAVGNNAVDHKSPPTPEVCGNGACIQQQETLSIPSNGANRTNHSVSNQMKSGTHSQSHISEILNEEDTEDLDIDIVFAPNNSESHHSDASNEHFKD